MDTLLLELSTYIVISTLIVMVTEYVVHRWVMHRLIKVLRPISILRAQQKFHAGDHHTDGDNSLELIDLPIRNWLVFLSPVIFLVGIISWKFSLTLILVCVIHCNCWSAIHRSSHNLGFLFLQRWPISRSIIKHHLGHHAAPHQNYGALFGPIMDILFRTQYRPK